MELELIRGDETLTVAATPKDNQLGIALMQDIGINFKPEAIKYVEQRPGPTPWAQVEDVLDKVTITADPSSSKVTSNTSKITFGSSDDTSNILYALNIVERTGSEVEEGSTGQDAKFTVDGASYVRTSNTIDDVIGGVTFTLQGVSSSNVTLAVNADTDTSLDAIATFVAEYNKVIEKLNPPELTDFDKQYLDPLTDEDKQSMTESQIDDYEKKYKLYTGYEIIRNTPELDSFLNYLRTQTFQPVEGAGRYTTLSEIGITTDFFGTFDSEREGYLITKSTDKDEIKEILSGNSTLMNA
jgi:flagellar hook-associated protein 2